ncbi:MAG TPA: polysaccharide biosynthesis tyrosine autokinase [Gemmatimonadaceae bacterium]|nr:polysaccharide biosynthesis tyrosine autokinase [Gemmatimonadaceae bacterium]
MDLRQVLVMLRQRIWLIFGITLAFGGLATWFALTSAPTFEATATVRLTDSRRELTGGLVDATPTQSLRTTSDPVLSEIAVLMSREVVGKVVDSVASLRMRTDGFNRRVVDKFSLSETGTARLPAINLVFDSRGVTASTPGAETVSAPYGAPLRIGNVEFVISGKPDASKHGKIVVLGRDDAVDRLVKSIHAKPREGTDVIDASFASTDPVLAQRVVNTLVAVFQENSIEDAAQAARLRRQFIEGQLKQNDSLLMTARLALSQFRSREKAYSAREKFQAQATDVERVQDQIREVQLEQRSYGAVLQQMRTGNGRESLQQLGAALSAQGAAASPIVTEQYQALVRLQGARDSLITLGSAPTNPDVKRIDVLETTAMGRLASVLEGIQSSLATRLNTLQGLRASSADVLATIPASDADEARLTESEEAYQKIADQLRDEYQRARLSEAAEVGSVEIVDLSSRPRAPIGTPSSAKILFGVLMGLFFGSGCALVIEHLDQSIRGRDDVESSLQLPGLAVIPRLENGMLTTRVKKALANGSTASTSGVTKPVSGRLVTVNDSRSVGAEAYRTLRTKLLFSRALSSLKTIVVTSPFAQDGKSTVAANLATTFAQHGMRTLLIDCDLRRPTQHEVFGVSSRPGLTELLTSDELIPGAGRRTSVENLSLITAGALPPDPPELVGSARMRALLEKLGETFDVIVLDTPPVLPVADSAILASLSDGVLLVVRAGQTDRRAAQLAVQQLQDVDARILGAVLNDPNEQVPLYDQYGYATYYGYAARE